MEASKKKRASIPKGIETLLGLVTTANRDQIVLVE